MRILIGHNHYQQLGGEDAVVKSEYTLLRDFGEDVFLYERSNKELQTYSAIRKIKHFVSLSWSKATYSDLRKVIRKFKPDVAHFHNIFFMLSPSTYYACKDEGVPVVQSLHNFRMLCVNALLFRNNQICEECLIQKNLWQGVRYGCYRDSRLTSAIVVAMLRHQWKKKTWLRMIDRYIAATEFTREKYVQGGLSKEKIVIKPHFVHQNHDISKFKEKKHALYVGRLSEEKGVQILIEAWKSIPDVPLNIVGGGPLENNLKEYVQRHSIQNIKFLGYINQAEYEQNMRQAKFLIVPSQCYENFPRIVVEAFSFGIPVLASRLGSLAELIVDGKNGALFEANNKNHLISQIKILLNDDKNLERQSASAHQTYDEKYSVKQNYKTLINIYQSVL